MTYLLFWTAEDWGNEKQEAQLFREPDERAQIFFDMCGAETPEEAQLPMSYWTKQRFVFYIQNSNRLRAALPVISRMKLEDLRACALKESTILPTGRFMSDNGRAHHEWRHTTFWSLDADWIGRVAKEATA